MIVAIFVGSIFVIAFLGPPLLVLFRTVKRYWIKKAKYYHKTDNTIQRNLRDFEYYKGLSTEGKYNFIRRVRYTAFYKSFIGKNGLEVTDEMRVEVAASLVQLTYGYKKFEMPHFEEIWIFPEAFYHPVNRVGMKGFTSPKGIVALSWVDFKHGYAHKDDNYNLGLHELTHALHINSENTFSNTHFRKHFSFWKRRSIIDFENLRSGTNTFLRDYGASNFHEFLSVCVEHFFESPEEFYEELPYLYIRTCILMGQNPMNVNDDYALLPKDFKELSRTEFW